MNKSEIDVAVLCLFFNRPDNFQQVFEQVKIARPSRLFLYQDGPRNEKDVPGILACREIVEDIDWECEVHTKFQAVNIGCDPSEYLSQKWMFEYVDKGIILEDDDVPSQSFFRFCKELLDRYEYDTRISIISGINYAESLENCNADYIFTSDIAIWGWATWKRFVDLWESDYRFLDDEYSMRLLDSVIKQRNQRSSIIPLMRTHKSKGKEFYETIVMGAHYLNSCLAIVPTKNLINNIGLTGGTHYSNNLNDLCPHERRIFLMKRYEYIFPLRHPSYIIEDVNYNKVVNCILDRNRPFHRMVHNYQGKIIRLYNKFKHYVNDTFQK